MNKIYIRKFFPYSTAFATGNRTSLPRKATKLLENAIWDVVREKLDISPDNKCTFEFEDEDFNTRYITFHDFNTYIGDQVEIQRAGYSTPIDLEAIVKMEK